MPRQTQIKKNKGGEVTQQDTFRYRQGISPSARPVHYETRVRPKRLRENLDLENFMSIMDDIKSGMRSGAKIQGLHNKEQMEAGQIAAAKGEKPAGDETTAWIEGFEAMKGAGEGYNQLSAALSQHYEEYAQEDPKTFDQTQDQVIREFMNGRTDAYIKGILPGAESLVAEYQGAFIQKKQEELHMAKIATTRNLMDAEITKIFKDESIEDKAGAVRGLLTDSQRLGEQSLDLSKMEVSAQLVDLLSRKAVANGNPDILAATAVPDENGIRLIDNPKLAKKIEQGVETAQVEKERRIAEAEQARGKALKDAHTDLTSNLSEMLMAAGQGSMQQREQAVQAIQKVLYTYGDESRNPYGIELTAKEIEHYHKEVLVLSGGDGFFAAQTNMDAYSAAYNMARLEPDQLTPERMDALKPLLERGDYEEIVKQKAQALNTRKSQGHKKSIAEKRYEQGVKKTLNVLGAKDPLYGSLFDNSNEREELGQAVAWAEWDAFIKEHNRQPTLAEQWEIRAKIKKVVNDALPAIPRRDLSPEGKARAEEIINGKPRPTIETDTIKTGFQGLKQGE
jgi:hypothetical protein